MPRTKTLHAIFDGNVLRPEEPVDLELNVRYLVTIKRKDAGKQSLWMCSTSSQEKWTDQKIDQKSTTITYTGLQSEKKGAQHERKQVFPRYGLCAGFLNPNDVYHKQAQRTYTGQEWALSVGRPYRLGIWH